MCFHYSLKNRASKKNPTAESLFSQTEIDFENLSHVNGFAFPKMPVFLSAENSRAELLDWGLIPFWTKTPDDAMKVRAMTLNARAETVFEKPSFRESAMKRRCLIPATGFFEWHTLGKNKYPFYISLTNDELFMFAGIWDSWTDKFTGEIIRTFSIVTTEANSLMSEIHNVKKRMPVILRSGEESGWINNDASINKLKNFLVPYDSGLMKAVSIKRDALSAKTVKNSENCFEQYTYPELQMLKFS